MDFSARDQDKAVARLMFAGFATIFLGIVFGSAVGWLGVFSGQGIANGIAIWVAAIVIGGCLFVAGLLMGLKRSGVLRSATPTQRTLEKAQVVAVLALNARQEPIWNEGTFDEHEIQRLVQLRTQDGQVVELRVEKNLWQQLGEGMKIDANVIGDRLLGYFAHIESPLPESTGQGWDSSHQA